MKHLKTHENINGITFKELVEIRKISINTELIDCNGEKLINLDGIEEFKNLQYLFCSNNKLKKIPDLSKLKKLEYLSIHNNNLTELPDLTNLPNLEVLQCSFNKLPFKCSEYRNNLGEYLEWHKKEYPWIYDAKKYNL